MGDFDKITGYLEHAKNLEANVYTHEKILDGLTQRVQGLQLEEKKLYEPKKPDIKSSTTVMIVSFLKGFLKSATIMALIYGLWVLYILITPDLTTEWIAKRNAILATFIALIFAVMIAMSKTSENNRSSSNKMNIYQNELNIYNNEKSKQISVVKQAKLEKDFLQAQYTEMDRVLKQTQSNLTTYYNNSVIYPKYLTMPAITQILEYFQSGRCNILTGPDGAYNLYENELRMNQIIGNLDVIVQDLEIIKNTQYMIYKEISRGNDIALQVLDSVDYACRAINNIEVNSAISAYNSEVIANNARAMNYYSVY